MDNNDRDALVMEMIQTIKAWRAETIKLKLDLQYIKAKVELHDKDLWLQKYQPKTMNEDYSDIPVELL